MSAITSISVEEWDIPLEHPFNFALGTMEEVENVLVTVEAEDGTLGQGEGCPVPAVSGETRGTAMAVVQASRSLVKGRNLSNYRHVIGDVREMFSGNVNTLFAIETAILDAYCRGKDMPLAELYGGESRNVETDVTLPIVEPEEATELAETAASLGFNMLKIKTGGEVEDDVARIEAVSEAAPNAELTVDANQAHTAKEAIRFVERVQDMGIDLELVEQPVPADDLDGLALVRDRIDIPVVADESVFGPVDAMRVIEKGAADVINVKMGKAGLLGAADIISIAEAAGLELMVGCMIESRIGIHAAAHVVAGTDAFSHVDLDGKPRHCDELAETQRGPIIELEGPGHGVRPDNVTFR